MEIFKKFRSDAGLFFRFIKYLYPYRLKWLFIIALGLTAVLLSLVIPYITKLIIDKAFVQRDMRQFMFLVGVTIVVFIAFFLTEALRNYFTGVVNARMRFDMNKDVFGCLTRLDMASVRNKASGEYLYRINYDVDRVHNFITQISQNAFTIFPKFILTLIIVFYLNWKLAVFSMVLAPILYIPSVYFIRKIRVFFQDWIKHSEKVFKYLEEVFLNILMVKSFMMEKYEFSRYERYITENTDKSIRNSKYEVLGTFCGNMANKAVYGGVASFGGYLVIKGEITLGSLTAILVYLAQLIILQHSFAWFFKNISTGLVSCGRLDELMSDPCVDGEGNNGGNASFDGSDVRFEHVTFGYEHDKLIVEDISLEIPSGACVAIVGPSGCGKTTLIYMLLRLYESYTGSIFIGGQNVRDVNTESLSARMSVALQEPFLWNDTIANNIKYGYSKASEDDMLNAAMVCGVDRIAQTLPDGYDTNIGEAGSKISEGQKQRIALARAIIKKPEVLILDEAMSSLDSESELNITRKIREMLPNSTIITISHRFSTIKSADFVHFFKAKNSIVGGSVDELLNSDKDFSSLLSSQIIS